MIRRYGRCRLAGLGVLLVATTAACSDEGSGTGGGGADAGGPLDEGGPSDLPSPDGGVDAGSDAGVFADPACDPLDPAACALPWPSDRYQEPDESQPRGFRFWVFTEATPLNRIPEPIQTERWLLRDGYSPFVSIHTVVEDLDPTGLPGPADLEASLAADASILLYRVEGARMVRVPYLLDAESVGSGTLLSLRPAAVLEPGARYVVAFRNLRRSDGSRVPVPPAFQALVEGRTAGTDLEQRQADFFEIIGRLDDEGVPVAEVQLAWDFWVALEDTLSQRLRAMLAAAGDGPPPFTFTSTTVVDEGPVFRWTGTFTAPNFLVDAEFGGATGQALADPFAAEPPLTGTVEVPFELALSTDTFRPTETPGDVVLLALDPFVALNQVYSDDLEAFVRDGPYLAGWAEWPGLGPGDRQLWRDASARASAFQLSAEPLLQAIVHQVLFARVLQALNDIPFFRTEWELDGTDVGLVARNELAGPALAVAALSDEVQRSAILRPVLDLPLGLRRSRALRPLLFGDPGMAMAYGGRPAAQVAASVVHMYFAEAGPAGFVSELGDEALLFALARGDHDASPLDTERLARRLDVPAMRPYAGRPVRGWRDVASPTSSSAVVLYDFGLPPPPRGPEPPPADAVDPGPSLLDAPEVQQMLRTFFRDGRIDCGTAGCALPLD